jgi:hypothetical protein
MHPLLFPREEKEPIMFISKDSRTHRLLLYLH